MTKLNLAEEYILPEQRLKISTFDTLNDPHELLCAHLGDKEERKIFQALRKYWEESLGIVSTSDDWRSPLMWAHYAENHRGVCLGFDVDEEMADRIHYEPERLQGLLDELRAANGAQAVSLAMLKRLLTTKFDGWKYEQEWRLIVPLDTAIAQSQRQYLNFGSGLVLREVILGARCPTTVDALATRVVPGLADVTLFQVRAGFKKFEMTQQLRVPPLVVPASK